MPIKSRPMRRAATPVEPLPIKQSSTVPPGRQLTRTSRSKISTGFWQVCNRLFEGMGGTCHTLQ